jgi:hypothetical protein
MVERRGETMYAEINFKTKKALKDAVKAGQTIRVFQPGGLFPGRTNGNVCVEGPHYPEPHRWYAEVVIKDSVIVSVK